jgi:signal transduction histidine kinase
VQPRSICDWVTREEYLEAIARGVQAESTRLAGLWLERLRELLPVDSHEVFPSPALLDHIPAILEQIGHYLRAPEAEEIAGNALVLDKARELGLLRHEQQASVHQLLREYEILGRILQGFVAEETRAKGLSPAPLDCISTVIRIDRAVQVLMHTTVDTFIAKYTDTIDQQTRQLESFNRMVSHELRNPLATVTYAVRILSTIEPHPDPQRARVLELLQRNVGRMRDLVGSLEQITRIRESADSPSVQLVDVKAVAGEVARQMAQMADARGVEVRVVDDLPLAEIDPGRLELILFNLVSNAVKYSDPAKPSRFVEIAAHDASDASADGRLAIAVRDNGLGIPEQAVPSLFARFFRAHAERDGSLGNEGSGLGLSIVQDCVDALGGTIHVDSTEGEGSTFVISLPARARESGEPQPG